MVSPFPMEICLDIFKDLAKEGEYDTLERCRVACRDFQAMAEKYLAYCMIFKSTEEVARIKVDVLRGEMRHWRGQVNIQGGNGRRIPYLATFASRFARRWTGVSRLHITRAVWRVQDIDADAVLRDLAVFSITHLHLDNVTFPTILTFGRLLSSLPRLQSLELRSVQFIQQPSDACTIAQFRVLPQTQLKVLRFGFWYDSPTATQSSSFVELLDVIASVSNRICQVPPRDLVQGCPWTTVQALSLDDVVFPSGTTFARLLCALPALERLEFSGSCTFMKHSFDHRSVPPRPGLSSRLESVSLPTEFGFQSGLHSDPHSVADLVDFFITAGISDQLRTITVWLSPYFQLVRESDIVLNRLIKHSGKTLQRLSLGTPLRWSVSNEKDLCVYEDQNTALYLDVSENTGLEHLALTVDVTRENILRLCTPVTNILSKLTSTHISSIIVQVHYNSDSIASLDIDLRRLMDDLPQLDAVLSGPIFDNLTHVVIAVHHFNKQDIRSEELVDDIRLCLPKLDERGILGISLDGTKIGLHRDYVKNGWKRCEVKRNEAVITHEGATGSDKGRMGDNATGDNTAEGCRKTRGELTNSDGGNVPCLDITSMVDISGEQKTLKESLKGWASERESDRSTAGGAWKLCYGINDKRTGHNGRLRTSSPYEHLTKPDYWLIAKPCTMVRPFPNEIWLDIFKGLAKEGEYDTVERCRVACREFHPIAKECLRGYIRFKSIEDVERIKVDASGGEMRRWGGPLRVYIDGGNEEDGQRPIPHLATFASRIAGRWPSVEELVITGAVCRARDLDLDAVFRDLAAFSITNLYLYDVIFPSILTLGRLVCAIPRLKLLCLSDVQFTQHPRDASTISHFRLLPRTLLDTLVLGHRHGALQLGNVTFPSVTTFARLLCALPALESLELLGSCAFVKHGFDLRSVPTDLGLPSQLADVDFGRHSEPRSVDDLVGFFISTCLTTNLRRITWFMSPILWVTTKSDAALDRLVKYSAQSLHHRSLQCALYDPDEWPVLENHSTASYFNVSSATCLEHLDLTVQFIHDNTSRLCDPVVKILSQVASAHISTIRVCFWPWDHLGAELDEELGKVLAGLPQLDAVFSRPIFNNLTDVHVHIRTPYGSNVRDEELAHDLRLCLPMLDARGILRPSWRHRLPALIRRHLPRLVQQTEEYLLHRLATMDSHRRMQWPAREDTWAAFASDNHDTPAGSLLMMME
ncbi:predicted protein [Postia placenta Mad-698-R]|nr:predicted protein [Postia placenta Mad-698-R]